MRIAALASHGGSIVQTVVEACQNQKLTAQVVLVISNNSRSLAIQKAAANDIPTQHLSLQTHPNAADLDAAICAALLEAQTDCVLLGGYMKKLGPKVLGHFAGRIVNTHPALLPKYGGRGFYGRKIHEAVFAAGERETGATVHLVDADYDTGPILAQVSLMLTATDTVDSIEAQVRAAERRLVVATLAHMASDFTQNREVSNVC